MAPFAAGLSPFCAAKLGTIFELTNFFADFFLFIFRESTIKNANVLSMSDIGLHYPAQAEWRILYNVEGNV